jgi:hypothetical protein
MSCLFCNGIESKLIQSSRVHTVISASCQREDNLLNKIQQGTTYITCHSNCLSTYCSKRHIARLVAKREKPESDEVSRSSKRLRSQQCFNFDEHCLFCGEDCCIIRPKKHPDRWREAYICRTVDRDGDVPFKDTVINHAKQREDEWGQDVLFRTLGAVSDLHAVNARYHVDCRTKFFYQAAATNIFNQKDMPLAELVKIMISDRAKIWNSVDVHEQYLVLGGSHLSRRTLVKYLDEHLSPDLLVLSSPGVASILIFRSKSASLLRIVDDIYNKKCQRSISYLSDVIKGECPQWDPLNFDTRISLNVVLKQCSKTLMQLLAAVSPSLDSTLSAAMIGHIVTNAVTGHATNLQISMSVLLNKQRAAVDRLHAFGVTASYNELRLFRISAAVSAQIEKRV